MIAAGALHISLRAKPRSKAAKDWVASGARMFQQSTGQAAMVAPAEGLGSFNFWFNFHFRLDFLLVSYAAPNLDRGRLQKAFVENPCLIRALTASM